MSVMITRASFTNKAPSLIDSATSIPLAVATVPPDAAKADTESTASPLITWVSNIPDNVARSPSKAVIVSSPSSSNASSVGANTVNVPLSSPRTSVRPVASRAATSVLNLPSAAATSTTELETTTGTNIGVGGINTVSITCITPFDAPISVSIT